MTLLDNRIFRIIIAGALTIAATAAIYFGAYLPLKKSQLYIQAYKNLPQVRSLGEFNRFFDQALDFYSPVGQDEIVSAYLGILLDVINKDPGPNKEITDILVKQAERRAGPLLASNSTFSYSQNFLKLALIYKLAATKFNDEIYYKRSVELLREGLVHSPNRPIFLYNLFDLYLFRQDAPHAREIGEIILRYWPDDQKVRQIMTILNSQSFEKPPK